MVTLRVTRLVDNERAVVNGNRSVFRDFFDFFYKQLYLLGVYVFSANICMQRLALHTRGYLVPHGHAWL